MCICQQLDAELFPGYFCAISSWLCLTPPPVLSQPHDGGGSPPPHVHPAKALALFYVCSAADRDMSGHVLCHSYLQAFRQNAVPWSTSVEL